MSIFLYNLLLAPLSSPVLFQLQDNFLITSEEREEMTNLDDVLRVQRCKHSTVMFETADILSQHGFQEFELQFLSGMRTSLSITCPCCIVQWGPLEHSCFETPNIRKKCPE